MDDAVKGLPMVSGIFERRPYFPPRSQMLQHTAARETSPKSASMRFSNRRWPNDLHRSGPFFGRGTLPVTSFRCLKGAFGCIARRTMVGALFWASSFLATSSDYPIVKGIRSRRKRSPRSASDASTIAGSRSSWTRSPIFARIFSLKSATSSYRRRITSHVWALRALRNASQHSCSTSPHKTARMRSRRSRLSSPSRRLDIADYLGLTVETVSREISKLKRAGLISTSGPHNIVLRRLDSLREIARFYDGADTAHLQRSRGHH